LNPPFGLTQVQLVLIAVGVLAVALLLLFGGRVWMLRRRDARRVARVTAGAADFLRNVLVPDGNGGDFHLDFLLLTSRGVVVIDMRDITGNVFGGDQMTDWTLMDGPRRSTFVNPQSGLYDRIASVKAVAQDGETPVEGRIVFTKRAKFPKGLPRFTVEARQANQAVVDLVRRVADTRGATPGQVALAWNGARRSQRVANFVETVHAAARARGTT